MATYEQAIIRTGGKQYLVQPGAVIKVEKLKVEVGEKLELGDVLMLGKGGDVKVGAPLISGAKVTGTVAYQGRAKKLIVYKFKRRKNYRRKAGHRQYFTEIKVDEITA